MTPLATSAAEFATIFNWRPPKSRKLSLLSFIAASAVLHALCFYIFQIVYPPAAAPLPPPARVNLITPASDEGRLLLRWIESEDPALSSTTQRAPHAVAFVPPKPDYVPSYLDRQPALKDAPPFEPDLGVPSSRPPGPVPSTRVATPTDTGFVPTRINFGGVETLGSPELPALQFAATSKEAPDAAQFRIAINAAGEVRDCFLQESSGDSALDEQARRSLLLVRFPASEKSPGIDAGLVWATATIAWGNDVTVPSVPPAP